MKKITQFLFVTLLMLCSLTALGQGVTTASINGQVLDSNSQPLPGANVVAVHTSSGTTYGAASDFDGNYSISLKPGALSYFSLSDAPGIILPSWANALVLGGLSAISS